MDDEKAAIADMRGTNADYRCLPPHHLFDMRKIANGWPELLKEEPLHRARKMICQGIADLKEPNTRASRLWKQITGFEQWRTKYFPTLTAEDCDALQYIIYVIYDR